ncbi:hypothetical protein Trco_001913 [Trichoderma cornu-damae]|uniref:Uncharacterized protein n=1 Tax=Trichoderma cornu-damae TaxID=654480 RepID=A0A9P8QTX8_9HYPO|nr:hypothetical protein Trco_001913 [Trichoderma cornu-damae]
MVVGTVEDEANVLLYAERLPWHSIGDWWGELYRATDSKPSENMSAEGTVAARWLVSYTGTPQGVFGWHKRMMMEETCLGIDQDRIGGQVAVDEASVVVQELQRLADLQQALLDLQLVNLNLPPPAHAVGVFGNVATGSAAGAAGALLLILFLQQA